MIIDEGEKSTEIVELKAVNPRGEIETKHLYAPAPRVTDLTGKRIALIHNQKAGASIFLEALEELLKAKYPTAIFIKQFTTTVIPGKEPAFYGEVAQCADLFIFGSGD